MTDLPSFSSSEKSAVVQANPMHALASVFRNRLTGLLSLSYKKVTRQIQFSEGQIVTSLSNAKSELPGSFLLKEKRLTEAQFNSYFDEIKKSKGNLWDMAFTLGVVQEGDREKLKAIYTTRLLESLSKVPTCQVQFHPTEATSTPLTAHSLRILIDAFQSLNSAHILSICPSLAEKNSISSDEKIEKKWGVLPLSPEEKGLLTVCRNNSVVSEVFSSSFLGKERIERLMAALWMFGFIELEDIQITEVKKHVAGLSPAERELAHEIKAKVSMLDRQTYYEWLGLSSQSKSEDIERAANEWIEKLSQTQVDKLFIKEDQKLPATLKEKILEAKKVLLNPDQRQEYNTFVSLGKRGSFLQQSVVGREQQILFEASQFLDENKYQEAFSVLEKGTRELPHSQTLISKMAGAALKAFGPKDATKRELVMNEFKRALGMSPVSHLIYEAYGEWMEAVGQKDKAIDAFSRAIRITPFSKTSKDALTRLSPDSADSLTVLAIQKNLQRMSLYDRLGLDPKATTKEIQASYREMSKRFHPDRFFKSTDVTLKEAANIVYKQMVQAYSTLKSPSKRAAYDQQLSNQSLSASSNVVEELSSKPIVQPTSETPRTAQGKKFYELALAALREGKIDSARLNLQFGLQVEPNNSLFSKKLQELK